MEGEEAGKNLYNAAASGDLNTIQQLLQQDPSLLDLLSFPCSRNLLHIATKKAQPRIVEEILRRNPQLAQDLDCKKWSPLHIAAAGGHVEIARKLLSCAPEILWSRDSQGMNPVHVAAMHGHAEMLKMLVEYDPASAKERMDRGQTTLHLCVKHGQLEALKVLVDKVGELVRAKDDDGETLLHFAARYRRVQTMTYLVESNKIDKKSRNSKGETPLEIMQESFPNETSPEVREIREALIIGVPANTPHEILGKMSDVTMVVVVLIATMAYQSIVSPPGGVWQEDSPAGRVGEAVIASHHPKLYKKFVGANTTAFVSSLISIFLLTTGSPSKSLSSLGIVMYGVWVSLAAIAISYGAALTVITPHMQPQSLDKVINIVVVVSIGLSLFVFVFYSFPRMVKIVTRNRRLSVGAIADLVMDEIRAKF